LGVTLASRGELEAAVVHFRRAAALNPAMSTAHVNLQDALKRLQVSEKKSASGS
jgi:Flp pilus assembly protein TadD